jgi:hypothetical protein
MEMSEHDTSDEMIIDHAYDEWAERHEHSMEDFERRLLDLLRHWYPSGLPTMLDRQSVHLRVVEYGIMVSSLDTIEALDRLAAKGDIEIDRTKWPNTIRVDGIGSQHLES